MDENKELRIFSSHFCFSWKRFIYFFSFRNSKRKYPSSVTKFLNEVNENYDVILPNVDLDYGPANPAFGSKATIQQRGYKFRRQVSIRISRGIIGESASLENFSDNV